MQRRVLQAPVTVEYDSRGRRIRKTLPNAYAARSFYKQKHNAGKRPRVVAKQSGNL
jgi:hypothetical protein